METLFLTKSLKNRLVLKQQLYTFRMVKGEILGLTLVNLSLFNNLKNVEANIDDKDQAMLLLCSLPPSYKTFRKTLIYGRETLT